MVLFGAQSNYTMNDHLEPAPTGSNLEFACRGCSTEHPHLWPREVLRNNLPRIVGGSSEPKSSYTKNELLEPAPFGEYYRVCLAEGVHWNTYKCLAMGCFSETDPHIVSCSTELITDPLDPIPSGSKHVVCLSGSVPQNTSIRLGDVLLDNPL